MPTKLKVLPADIDVQIPRANSVTLRVALRAADGTPIDVLSPGEVDAYAKKGWVDLRAPHLAVWSKRLAQIVASRRGGSAGASDALARETYGRDDFRIGEVVAWVFANDPEFRGFRIK